MVTSGVLAGGVIVQTEVVLQACLGVSLNGPFKPDRYQC